MPITSVHPDYSEKMRRVEFVRDMCSDEFTVKDKGVKYLPAAFAVDEPERYKAYKDRAFLLGATGKTKRDMIGAGFRKPAAYELPDALLPLVDNFDGGGNGIEAVNKSGVDNVLQAGRHAILIDYPSVDDGMTAEQEARLNLMPYAAEYKAEAIDNHEKALIFGREMLTMIKLVEWLKVTSDEFSFTLKKTYRVLRLRSPEQASEIFGGSFSDYVYTQALYDEGETALTPEYAPRKPSAVRGVGATFNYIPFFMVDLDRIPLMDIAVVNRSHYQVTADYRENLHTHGQLTLGVVTSMSTDEFNTRNPDGIKVGASKGHILGPDGDFKTVSAPESSSLNKALDDMQLQMESMGAKLMTEGGEKTAEEARINASSQTSALDMVISVWNSQVVTPALKACAEYKGVNPDLVSYSMNRDYYDTTLSAQEAGAIVTIKDSGAIAIKDMQYMLRTGRIKLDPNRTDEDIAADIESESI